jgi:hypothetical protein
MRRSAASRRCHGTRISASFSAWSGWLRSGSWGTRSLNRVASDRVKRFLAAGHKMEKLPSQTRLKPGMSSYFTVVRRKYICAILQTRIAQRQIFTKRVGWHYATVSPDRLSLQPYGI